MTAGFRFAGARVKPGERRDFYLPVSETHSGAAVTLPIQVWRGAAAGPTVFISAAVHGDEINGTGAIRRLILDRPFELVAGSLILVPVVNILGFERHSRYLPDRRDLNRCFPGSPEGSVSSRYAATFFGEVVKRADFGIDLHTGAVRRTNFPNLRGDLDDDGVRRIAEAFGSELIVNGKGPEGSLRRAACEAGCPTLVLEAGEVWKVEPSVIAVAVRGIRNVLIELGMVKGRRRKPVYQARVDRTTWLRADAGGMLRFHVSPGDVVAAGQPIATCSNLLGADPNPLLAPIDGIVLGMTTLPSVTPGDPVCHLAEPHQGIGPIREALAAAPAGRLHARVRSDLATNLTVLEAESA